MVLPKLQNENVSLKHMETRTGHKVMNCNIMNIGVLTTPDDSHRAMRCSTTIFSNN